MSSQWKAKFPGTGLENNNPSYVIRCNDPDLGDAATYLTNYSFLSSQLSCHRKRWLATRNLPHFRKLDKYCRQLSAFCDTNDKQKIANYSLEGQKINWVRLVTLDTVGTTKGRAYVQSILCGYWESTLLYMVDIDKNRPFPYWLAEGIYLPRLSMDTIFSGLSINGRGRE